MDQSLAPHVCHARVGYRDGSRIVPEYPGSKLLIDGRVGHAPLKFKRKRTYNEHWMLERYDYQSPAQVRRDLVGLDAAA